MIIRTRMTRKRTCLLIIISCMLAAISAAPVMAMVPETLPGSVHSYLANSDNETLASGQYVYATEELIVGDMLNFSIYVTSGAVEFYILDEDSFDDFNSSESFTFFLHFHITGSNANYTNVPYESQWYMVLYNDPDNGISSISVTFFFNSIYTTAITTTVTTVTTSEGISGMFDSFSGAFVGFVIAAGVLLIIFLFFARSRRASRDYRYNVERPDRRQRSSYQQTGQERVLRARSTRSTSPASGYTARPAVIENSEPAIAAATASDQLVRKKKVSASFCSKCGNPLTQADKFCTKCGATIKKIVQQTKPPATKQVSRPAGEIMTAYRVLGKSTDTCRHCGKILPVSAESCPDCGALRVNCPICKRNINFTDTVGTCPDCMNSFHYAHLRETVKVTGKCPMCRTPLKEEEILVKSQQAK